MKSFALSLPRSLCQGICASNDTGHLECNVNRVPSSAIANLNLHYKQTGKPWSADSSVLNIAERAELTTTNTDIFRVGAVFEQFVLPRQFIAKVAYKFD